MNVVAAWFFAEAGALRPRAQKPGARLGLLVLGLVFLGAVLTLVGNPLTPLLTDPSSAHQPPSRDHWFGTDHLGRDIGWRLMWATRTFVGPGLLAAGTSVGLGAMLGLASGADTRFAPMTRLVTSTVASIPPPVWVLLLASIHGSDWWVIASAFGIANAPAVAMAVHRRVQGLVRTDFVDGLVLAGLNPYRVLFVHLLLYASARLLIREGVLAFGGFLAVDAGLAYLGGSGVREPNPSWGNMLAFEWGRGGHPLVSIAPILCLVLTLAALHRTAALFADVRVDS